MFEIIFTVLCCVYFTLLVFIFAGLSRKFPASFGYKPNVSVIVAARDEEANIAECLISLSVQSYPVDMYEVIVADDHSTDNTGKIIDDFISSHSNFIKVIPQTNDRLTGKINALAAAAGSASGQIFLFTDADCIVPQTWIESIVSYYGADTGMVNGFSYTSASNLLNAVQNLDLIFLVSIAAGMSNNGIPVSCIGNNMSASKKALQETGSYFSFGKSVTEDYLLLNKINGLRKYSIVFPVDPGIVVKTKPQMNLREIFRQKKRWASGGLTKPNLSLLLQITAFLTNLSVILSVPFFSKDTAIILSLKVFSDFFFLFQVHKKLKLGISIVHLILFELYYILYTTILPVILLLNRKITWKDREY